MCCPERAGSSVGLSLSGFGRCGTGPEAKAVIAGFEDVAVVSKAIEQGSRHLGIAEDAGPFAETQVGGDHDAGALIQLAEQVEQQGPA